MKLPSQSNWKFVLEQAYFFNLVWKENLIQVKTKMSERENNVYKAKLAEQAERYDGELKFWLDIV